MVPSWSKQGRSQTATSCFVDLHMLQPVQSKHLSDMMYWWLNSFSFRGEVNNQIFNIIESQCKLNWDTSTVSRYNGTWTKADCLSTTFDALLGLFTLGCFHLRLILCLFTPKGWISRNFPGKVGNGLRKYWLNNGGDQNQQDGEQVFGLFFLYIFSFCPDLVIVGAAELSSFNFFYAK